MHYFTETEARCFTGDLTEYHYFPITINKRQSCHKPCAKIYHSTFLNFQPLLTSHPLNICKVFLGSVIRHKDLDIITSRFSQYLGALKLGVFGGILVISEDTAVINRQAYRPAAALQSYAEGTILPPIRLNEKINR